MAVSAGTSSFNRRNFLRMAGIAAALPIMTEADFAWAAQAAASAPAKPPATPPFRLSRMFPPSKPGAVLINANENPLGPAPVALKAIAEISPSGGRYDQFGETLKLMKTFADQQKLDPDYVFPYAGSSEPLHYATLAFTSPERSLVTADPTYEAPGRAAGVRKATIHAVPLAKDYSHDVKAMVAADANAGVLYICNPNNPTGTITRKADIVWALEHKPAGSILLVDEAYIHLSGADSMLDQVAAGKDLIVLRTFSKVYGMAGIRCGFACARPDLLMKLMDYGFNALPITSLAAARASLEDATLVPSRKKIIGDTRSNTLDFLRKGGYPYIPSESNCFMVDVGRPGQGFIAEMAAKNVFIGRVWPVWPNFVRVTVGTPDEMKKFAVAFQDVMSTKTYGKLTFSEPSASHTTLLM